MSVFYGTIRAVKTAAGSLGAVLLQLREFGVLPKTDARILSAVAILAVEPVAGSWWSHPRAHEIFRALESLADHQSRVSRLVARIMDRAGIAFGTLVPTKRNTLVYVVDINRELRSRVLTASRRLRARVTARIARLHSSATMRRKKKEEPFLRKRLSCTNRETDPLLADSEGLTWRLRST